MSFIPLMSAAILIKPVIIFLSLVFVPIGVSAIGYWSAEPRGGWQTADRSSAGLLPEASRHPDAVAEDAPSAAGAVWHQTT